MVTQLTGSKFPGRFLAIVASDSDSDGNHDARAAARNRKMDRVWARTGSGGLDQSELDGGGSIRPREVGLGPSTSAVLLHFAPGEGYHNPSILCYCGKPSPRGDWIRWKLSSFCWQARRCALPRALSPLPADSLPQLVVVGDRCHIGRRREICREPVV